MIQLTDLGHLGLGNDPLDLDETQVSSVSVDPVESDRTVVTMQNGTWFLVSESVEEVNNLISAAKS
jgi:uncharacterized protein YlzI (FlbEa/FlbD family)